jgi:hypothetical protein
VTEARARQKATAECRYRWLRLRDLNLWRSGPAELGEQRILAGSVGAGLAAFHQLPRLREGFTSRSIRYFSRLDGNTVNDERRVLQTSQKWPEIAGSKCRGVAKLGEKFQWPSPKAVVLPLHHSPRFLNNIRGLIGILRVLASDWIDSAPSVRRSTRSLPALASARR